MAQQAAPSSDLGTVVVNLPQTTTDAPLVTVTVVRTDSQGSTVTALEAQPAVIHTTTDAQGRATVVTSAAQSAPTAGEVPTETDAEGSTFVTTYSIGGGRVSSITLITITGADGKPSTITSYVFVDPAQAGPASATPSIPTSSQTSLQTSSPTSSTVTTPQSTLTTNPGIIVGATLADVALLMVLVFLAWYFGFHRRQKNKATAREGQEHEFGKAAADWQ
ncbi:hypothetical protein EK21DRAFT_90504 [Setomelanomma holmii]|uniref:Uncharacterized protein n=1 Tax=Setomelanomma holmii TaxID=210430 RepID=A0A9P4H8P3_9PLEO|nr:hypothetical protein EK21DRAFT_90504 [Setomelanomma holmii]